MADPTLIGMPPEVFERIAQLADKHDLLSLRLTCRDAASKVLRTFKEAHFSHRGAFLWQEDSIRRAIEVAKHSTFGPAVTNFSVYVNEVLSPDEMAEPDFWPRCLPHGQEQYEQEQGWKEQEALKRSDTCLDLLTILFARLRMHGAQPSISIDTHDGLWFNKTGWEVQSTDDPTPGDDKSFLTIVEALALSKLEPIAFKVKDYVCCARAWNLTLEQAKMVESAWCNAHILHVTLCLDFEDENDQYRTPSFCQAISKACKSLTELELSNDWESALRETYTFTDIFLEQHFGCLRKLALRGLMLHSQKLLAFLNQHSTMETLILDEVKIVYNPDSPLYDTEREALETSLTSLRNVELRLMMWVQPGDI